eukprot:GEMP01035849.1.p1 GENE.GEMP01035849.1~~GEMP01035849.1.p1  ORF type:complete len:323 (+),score=85.59 GEMP01035849.1:727-1695(+)
MVKRKLPDDAPTLKPAPGLLRGHEEQILKRLKYDPNGEAATKQRAFRETLKSLHIGDVATNNVAFRQYVGHVWALARLPAPRAALKPTPCIVPDPDESPAPLTPDKKRTSFNVTQVTATVRQRLRATLGAKECIHLRAHGVVLLRNIVPRAIASQLIGARPHDMTATATCARRSRGDGEHVRYRDWPHPFFPALSDVVVARLVEVDSPKSVQKAPPKTKALCLEYGAHGVNWLHNDANPFDFQAALMLSDPRTDFCGGELYVAKLEGHEGNRVEHSVAFREPGDLAIFRANGEWYHGVKEVKERTSSKKACLRVTLGFLQPP